MLELTAGGLSAVLAGAALRDLRIAGRPALDAVYFTVRDAGWRTAPDELLSCDIFETERGTRTELEVRHQLDEIDFRWRGTVETTADLLRFTVDGVAESDFDANRIGFCLLHPQPLKGRSLRVDGPAGERTGTFPEAVSPHQLFVDIDHLAYDVGGGGELDIRMSGDLFEIEDHRNWSDPGWKTYCTPLSAARPVHHVAGERLRRAVELRASRLPADPAPALVRHAASAESASARDTIQLHVGTAVVGSMPRLGLGARCASSARTGEVDATAREAVRALCPAHLHVELEDGTAWENRCELAAGEAVALGVPLDVALVAAPGRLASMARRLASGAGALGRVSVYSPTCHTTDPGAVSEARAVLHEAGSAASVGGGSRAHLAQLNRASFDLGAWDFISYGLTPQVHHTDDAAILATADAVADGLVRARAIARGLPVVVGPITLRPRFNADTGRADPLPSGDADGPDVDPRQRAALAALYLAAVVPRLVGADAVTVYRTAGVRGILTAAGEATPAARVVAALASVAGAAVRRVDLAYADPRRVDAADATITALATETAPGLRLLVTNRAERAVRLEMSGARAIGVSPLVGGQPAGFGSLGPGLEGLVLPARSVVSIEAVAT